MILNNLYLHALILQIALLENPPLSEIHYSVLFDQLKKHAADWKLIGPHLGFTQSHLKIIEATPLLLPNAPISWLSQMLAQWLQSAPGDSRGSTGYANLASLRDALRKAGFGATADALHI